MFKRIYLEITDICNLQCQFCFDKKGTMLMSLNDIKGILPELKQLTDYLYLHIKGEPTAHPEFAKILDECAKNKLQIIITTNGSYLNVKKELLLSHQAIRQINISLQSINYQLDIEDYLKALKEFIDFNKNKIINLRLWTEEQNRKLDIFLETEFNIKSNEIFSQKKLTDNLFISKEQPFIWPDLKNEIISNSKTCQGTITQIGILVDGTVVPCCLDSKGIINFGNIFRESLIDILASNKFIEFQDKIKNHKKDHALCLRCNFYRRR
ncbi:MAG: SPASM domain-containing protein [Erysipelotrichales bacterium]|nr:SPASM domain-containing protein [Erysipelotrichales bacterium]